MNRIQIHFDGDIVNAHKVSMRTLGKTLFHLQNAMDRAYIENKYGEVWKHARMKAADFKESEFLVEEPKEGGYILDFLANNNVTRVIVDRIASALTPAIELAIQEGEDASRSLTQQIETRKTQINKKIIEPVAYEEFLKNPSKQIIRQYGDRSITKEIDQILAIIRSKNSGNSTFELVIHGSKSHNYLFNKYISENFHQVVSKRSLGDPIVYLSKVQSLDSKNKNGKIVNMANERIANVHFHDKASFLKAKEFLGTEQIMRFIGCPLIEYGSFDPQAGDILFIDLG